MQKGPRAAYIIRITFGGALGRVRAAVPYGLEVARDEQDGRVARRTCARRRHRHAAPRRAPARLVQRAARARARARAGGRAGRRAGRAQRSTWKRLLLLGIWGPSSLHRSVTRQFS